MKWKKIRKILVLMAVTATCLFGANGVTAYANVDENAVAEAEKQAQQTEAPPAEDTMETFCAASQMVRWIRMSMVCTSSQ